MKRSSIEIIPLSDASKPSITVRPIANTRELEHVYKLTHECYVDKNYAVPRPNELFIHYPHFDYLKQTTIFIALLKDEIVGSISYTLDSRYGLPLDDDFKKECNQIRGQSKNLCAVWRFVVKPSYRAGGQVLMQLIDAVFANFFKQGGDTLLLIINPTHEKAYRRMLNMRPLASHADSTGLQKAPAVLMGCFLETLPAKWKNRYVKELRQGQRLYQKLDRAA